MRVDGGGSSSPSTDANCGQQTYGTNRVPPDLLIVLDKSGSMDHDANDKSCSTAGCSKWSAMTAAINQVVMQTQGTIRWGLKFFPDPNDNQCGVNAGVSVGVGPNNAAAIAGAIGGVSPGGRTPTRTAETNGGAYLKGLTDTNPKFILLATDGLPNCMPNATDNTTSDATGAVQSVMSVAATGIPTYVVGVGNVTDAQSTLTSMAIAGGVPQAAAPRYYPVASTSDLVSVLTSIGMQITSCTFSLGGVPPDPSNIAVLAGGAQVPKDTSHTQGWDYTAGMASIQLYGSYCTNVMNMTTTDVHTIFGCPGEVIIIP